MKAREYWLDYLRAFACILVTVGHLLMSFQDANMVGKEGIVELFVDFIYCFHVYIFFFCSGYLFQKSGGKLHQNKEICAFRIEKCINYLAVYVLFSGITYFIKSFFSGDVNTPVEADFITVIVKQPINQMWYLYAISVIFLFAHRMRTGKSMRIVLGVSLAMKIIACIPVLRQSLPVPVNYLFDNMIWFAMGQFLAYKKQNLKVTLSLLLAAALCGLFAVTVVFGWKAEWLKAILTLLGVLASVGIVYNLTKSKTKIAGAWKLVSKYMLQIYLLHTIFAAAIRVVLMKIGVTHILVHFVIGLLFSFALPILCAMVAERIWILNIVFFPVKTVKSFLAQKNKYDNAESSV